MSLPIAVMASGSGTNFEHLVVESLASRVKAEVRLLVTDKPHCGAHERAQRLGVPVFATDPGEYPRKALYEEAIADALRESGARLVVLAGYMRLVGPGLLSQWEGRMINLHPSLLPAFPGLDAVGQALEAGVKVTGATVHIVDQGMDTGPIIAQRAFAVPQSATREDIFQILKPIEHDLLARAVNLFAEERIQVEGRIVNILESGEAL